MDSSSPSSLPYPQANQSNGLPSFPAQQTPSSSVPPPGYNTVAPMTTQYGVGQGTQPVYYTGVNQPQYPAAQQIRYPIGFAGRHRVRLKISIFCSMQLLTNCDSIVKCMFTKLISWYRNTLAYTATI
jgi:hypothetical protein